MARRGRAGAGVARPEVYPFLWSSEAKEDLAATSRRPAPMRELFAAQDETVAFFAANPDAEAVQIRVQ